MNRALTYGCLLLAALLSVSAPALRSQEPDASAPKKTAPAADIFSGTVTKLTDTTITVVRREPGHDAVTRKFLRDGTTKVEGKLRERSRVTVRYTANEDDSLLAVYILVR